MRLLVKKLDPGAKLPARAHDDDAGLDLYALRYTYLAPGEIYYIDTGIAMEIPSGYVGLIWDKSSLGNKGIKVFGGVIDAQYRGEISVILGNFSKRDVEFQKGQKIAQLLIQKVELLNVVEVDELTDTDRATGGFGSTGTF